MAVLKVFLLFLTLTVVSAEEPGPTVKVPHGVLQGAWKVSTKGRTYASFQGVPYARPPVGKYRFREPQPVKPWVGIWDATRLLPQCLQYDPLVDKIEGSENCLFVNVYTPTLNPSASLPVLVFIHGGVYMYGAGNLYTAPHIMDRDMVVVTVNYRLGPLGFLSTGDEVVPGNNGLKDQSFALHWIRNNIKLFGGNPDNIVLTGCSAGGASVHYHYLSPLSRGTFSKGIAFSGAAFASWVYAVKPAQKAKALAAIVGCPTTTSREILDCLKYRPAEAIVNAQVQMLGWKVKLFGIFTPTIEVPGVRDPFLTQYPWHASNSGAMQNLPLIASVTSEEGLYPAAVYQSDPSLIPELEARWQELASNIFEYNDTLPLNRRAEVAAKIKEHYLNNKPVSQETYPQLVQAMSDRLFVADVGKLAQIHAKSGQPTYVYRYAYRGVKSFSDLMAKNTNDYGVSHGDDVITMFEYPGLEKLTPDDQKMLEELLDMVYSYATTGVPTFGKKFPKWTPVKAGAAELDYLDISSATKVEMKSTTDFGQKAFWDSLGFYENENYRQNIKDEL